MVKDRIIYYIDDLDYFIMNIYMYVYWFEIWFEWWVFVELFWSDRGGKEGFGYLRRGIEFS